MGDGDDSGVPVDAGPPTGVGAEGTRFPTETGEPSDVTALAVTRAESRAILDHKLRLLDELDDKAMRTVRTAVVVLGVLLSGAGVLGPTRIASLDSWTRRFAVVGVGLLSFCVLAGIFTSTDSTVRFGPDEGFRGEVRERGYTETEWFVMLLEGYDEWITAVDAMTRANALRLAVVQAAFALAVLSLLAAVGLLLMPA